jgi:hypothetical protein
MTRVKILKPATAYPDGIAPVLYQAGQEFFVNDNTLHQLIDQGAVEIVEDKAIHSVPETKPMRGRKRASKV